jgi:hypothetical protein
MISDSLMIRFRTQSGLRRQNRVGASVAVLDCNCKNVSHPVARRSTAQPNCRGCKKSSSHTSLPSPFGNCITALRHHASEILNPPVFLFLTEVWGIPVSWKVVRGKGVPLRSHRLLRDALYLPHTVRRRRERLKKEPTWAYHV